MHRFASYATSINRLRLAWSVRLTALTFRDKRLSMLSRLRSPRRKRRDPRQILSGRHESRRLLRS